MPAVHDLPTVRRFEAAGFRAWPAASVRYDGAWAVRLTPQHPAKRLNSVNPLDPNDIARLDERIARVSGAFADVGRPLTFRMSPLASGGLDAHLDALGWSRFDDSVVMRIDLSRLESAAHAAPLPDRDRFVRAVAEVRDYDAAQAAGLATVLAAIKPAAGFFLASAGGRAAATAVCVVDAGLAGLFEIATAPSERGKGHARRTVTEALQWARATGATTGWLQVEAANEVACGLYRSMGFEEVYRYVYRQPQGTA